MTTPQAKLKDTNNNTPVIMFENVIKEIITKIKQCQEISLKKPTLHGSQVARIDSVENNTSVPMRTALIDISVEQINEYANNPRQTNQPTL